MASELTISQRAPAGLAGLPPAVRQILMLAAVAGAVALGVMAAFWGQTPNYGLLYGNLNDKDTGGVIEALSKANIPYKIDEGSGAIMVPAKQVHEARLKLAGQGLPRGTGVGFEIMDEKPAFGNTQFQEIARYQRAIEGEIARSIMTLSNVQSARVHLAIPRQSAFIREREQPSASVLLNLYSGRPIEPEQVSAIVHLVASSVPNLPPDRVTVIDQKGKLLTSSDATRDLSNSSNQLDYRRKLEESYARRIEEILTPITGTGSVKAQVAADVDFTITETARESYSPDGHLIRSEQTAEETNANGANAGGIPGALSNQPPGAASVPETTKPAAVPTLAGALAQAKALNQGQTQAASANNGPVSSSKSATRNYEIDKTISHIKQPTGNVRRLSVAVVVDDVVTVSKKGKVTRTARTPEELTRMTSLVREAVGFDEKRGDSVNVTNAAFSVPAAAGAVEEPPLWKQEWLWDIARQVGGGLLALLLLLLVVRPLLRGLQARPVTAVATAGGGVSEDRLSLSAPTQSGMPAGYESQMTAARTAAQQDPKRVAQVVKNWVATDG
jgi:flagellar M-ring protein FliF